MHIHIDIRTYMYMYIDIQPRIQWSPTYVHIICNGYMYIYAYTMGCRAAMPLGAHERKPQSPWPTSGDEP